MTANGARPTDEVVVDASVALKWLLRDEHDLAPADALLDRYDAGELVMYAPRQIEVEVVNGIRKAVLNQRIPAEASSPLMTAWLGPLGARLRLAANGALLPTALPRSLQLGITLFDALYIVLAEELSVHLVVADRRLLHSPASQLPFIRDLAGGANPEPP